MKKSKKLISFIMAALFISFSFMISSFAEEESEKPSQNQPFDVEALSAVLMEASTGRILYAKNAEQALPPASVTKVMTLLLVMEALDAGKYSLSDMVQVSDYASGMGGSQVFLKAGETMSVEDMIKSVVIASANDAAVALAEFTAGSVDGFVELMNQKAEALGLTGTHFENPTGLDDNVTNHTMSAWDIAIISKELLAHGKILEYSSIWMDSIRNGEFGLTNTNRLIRFYNGATGLKTGSTSKAKFCISATAKRDGMHLIAVIMGSETRDIRNEAAKKLLDWGFANYCLYTDSASELETLPLIGGRVSEVKTGQDEVTILMESKKKGNIEKNIEYEQNISAPVKKGDVLGKVTYSSGGETLGSCDVTALSDVDKISYSQVLLEVIRSFFIK